MFTAVKLHISLYLLLFKRIKQSLVTMLFSLVVSVIPGMIE